MTQRTKTITLLFLAGTFTALVLLSTSLSNMQLHSGVPFPFSGDPEPFGRSDPVLTLKTYTFPMLQGVLAFIFIGLLIYVSARLLLAIHFKEFLRIALAMVGLLTMVYLIPHVAIGQPSDSPAAAPRLETPVAETLAAAPFEKPPLSIIWLVAIVLLLGVSLPLLIEIKRRLGSTRADDRLLQQAEKAVHDIRAGGELRDVIMRCYMQLARLLQEEQGIERNTTMTPREFEGWLEEKGFPAAPVSQLTSLFEKVRYGKQQMTESDESAALQCLNEIIQFCRLYSGENL